MEENWKRQVRREASAHHMCEENRSALSSVETKRDAIELYKKTVDWALEEGYPCLDTLRRDFSDCEEFGVFVGKRFNGELLNDQNVYVFHQCSGEIRVGLNVGKRIIPMLYFANDCNIVVKGVGDPSFSVPVRVPCYVFGSNTIATESSDELECKIYKFQVK